MSDGEVSTAAAPDTGAKASTSGRAAMLLGVLWIAGAYATFLRYNAYPLWRLDVLAGMALLAVGPIAIGWIYGRLGRVARACLLGLFAYVVARANGAGHHWSLAGAIAVGIAGYFAEQLVLRFGSVMGAVVLGWAMLGLSERTPPVRQEGEFSPVGSAGGPPPIVHLILDEHGGKPAIDLVDRNAKGTWAAVEKTYLDHGFTVWRNAYSRYYFTISSVPEMLGLGRKKMNAATPHRPGALALIERLSGAGYRVHLVQSEYLDTCRQNRVTSCTTFGYASLHQMTELRFADRLKLPIGAFVSVSLSELDLSDARDDFSAWLEQKGWPFPRWLTDEGTKVAPLNSKASLRLVTERVSRMGDGEALIAHLLLPHDPYMFDRQCELLPYNRWHLRKSHRAMSKRSSAYADQLACTNRLVGQLVSAASPRTIIVVHGDHGPRIVDRELQFDSAHVTPHELATGYSTLFAVRLPGQQPRVEVAQKPVSMLLAELAGSRWQKLPSLPPPTRRTVMLHHPEPDRMVEAQLPDWTTPAPTDSPSR